MDEDFNIVDIIEIDENEDIQNVSLEILLKGSDGAKGDKRRQGRQGR